MVKKQLATTLEEDTIKKIKMLAAEYSLNFNDVLEVVLYPFTKDDSDKKFYELLEIYKNRSK